jgi:sigma-B regulation protein RsbU (phosphoserine phosphatase)
MRAGNRDWAQRRRVIPRPRNGRNPAAREEDVNVDAALIPQDEAERLEAIRRYDILDTPPDGSFDRLTALAAKHFGVPISIVSIVDSDRIWFKSHHGVEVQEIGRDPGLCASAILQDGPWVVEDAAIDPRTLANPLVAGDFGLRFYAGVPLHTRDGHNLGTLCLLDQTPRELSAEEAATLGDLAAIVMDELELRLSARTVVDREQELRRQAERTARSLQESLLPPELPSIEGAELAALYLPAHASEVGGDFYDAFPLGAGAWALVVGDVSGKGSAAAAVTALARHTIRTAALSSGDPAEMLDMLNRAMFLGRTEGELEHFCTVHVSVLREAQDGFVVRTASAGHPPGLVMRAGGAIEQIDAAGPPVGWHDAPRFTAVETALAPGDVLVIHTDGITDARRDGQLLGEDRVARVLESASGGDAEAIVARLLEALSAPGVEVRDDAAVVVARVAA